MNIKLFLTLIFISAYSFAQIPSGYYNTATGTGYTLKTQLYNKIAGHTNPGYTGLWTTYATSDRDNQYENDNTIIDLYSENPVGPDPVIFNYVTDQCGTYSIQGDCYNREHVIPQSIYNSASPMVSDAHFVIPTDGYVNGIRSNYPHGNVATTTFTSLNGSKRGTSAVPGYTGNVFEPLNEFKGDIARMYFYFATRYQNTVASYTSYPMFNGTSDTVFKSMFLTMLITWHTQDPVSAREIARNNAIYLRQNNRNPFIDHPEYVSIIWAGSSSSGPQTITFNALPNVMYGGASFTLNATASSGLPVSYTSSNTNAATIAGNIVTIVGLGTTTITASQAGNSIFTPAPSVTQTLTVTQATQLITFNPLVSKAEGSAPFALTATGGGSGNAITYTSSNPAVATIIGNMVTIVAAGTTNITASQAGNTNYLAAGNSIQSFTVTNGIVAGWDFNPLSGGTGVNNFGPSPYPPTFSSSNSSIGGLTRGSGIGSPSTSAAAARAWGGTINTSTATSAISINSAITFTVKPTSGYAMDLSAITPIDYRRSSTGATNALVQYNINGGAYINVTTLNFTSSSSAGASAGTIDLSSIAAFQNIHSSKTITLRILPYGGTGGTFYFFDRTVNTNYDLAVLGNVRLCNPSNSLLTVTIPFSATPYLWNGQNITSSGIFTSTFSNSLGCDSIASLNLTVLPNDITLHVNAFIQGYYAGSSSMNPVLLNQGESANNLLCDTVNIELHESISPYNLVENYTGVMSTSGLISCTFPGTTNGLSCYIVLKHRNCIETWSANPILLSSNTTYTFSDAANKAYGDNQVEIEPGIFAFYNGDINLDGSVEVGDFSIWESDASNFSTGYLNSDLDGDGAVTSNDFTIWEVNSNGFVGVVKP